MKIKEKTFYDKLYDNRSSILFFIALFGMFFIALYFKYNNAKQNALATRAYLNAQALKVKTIIETKPTLVCDKKMLKTNQYDLITINDKNYIVTEDTINNPTSLFKVELCEIYTNITNSIIITQATVIPVEKEYRLTIKKLQIGNEYNKKEILMLKSELQSTKDVLKKANNYIETLKSLIEIQDKELDRLLITEARYNEVKSLLTIVLEKKDIQISDLVIKAVPIKTNITKDIKLSVMKASKIKKYVIKLPIKKREFNTEEHIKRIIYVIATLTNMHSNPASKFKAPSVEDLNKIKITEKQIKSGKKYIEKLLEAMEIRISIYANMLKLNKTLVRNNIKESVGI